MALGSDLRIAVLPGDGIGIEVMAACLEVLDALAKKSQPSALRLEPASRRRDRLSRYRQCVDR